MKLRIRHGAITVWSTLSTVTSRLGGVRAAGMAALLALTLATNLSGCGRQPTAATGSSPSVQLPATSIMVFAAMPLKPAFTLLAGKFQTDNPGATIDFDFATSSELANKLTQGANADIFASADSAQMDTVVKADLTGSDPVNFACSVRLISVAIRAEMVCP